jgi:predicted nuclease with RNAse H fold
MRLYAGIDVALGRFDVAVLDGERRIHALPAPFAAIDVLVGWLLDHAPDSYIAIDAPQRTREGQMALEEHRSRLSLPPPAGRYHTTRECDYELMRRGLPLYSVPTEYALCPGWMREGFRLFGALLRAGRWTLFDGAAQSRCLLEVYPFAAFAVMLAAFPPRKSTPAGRAVRLQALQARLAPEAAVCEAAHHHALDALAAAYTAWSLDHGQATWVGDPREGLMVVPGPLRDRYRVPDG